MRKMPDDSPAASSAAESAVRTAAPASALDDALAQALKGALALHADGHLDQARQLYCAILQAQPQHAPANHQLGLLMVTLGQSAEALPHLAAALEAAPAEGAYWVSYIDTLALAGQADTARQVLALGQQHGLAGEAVDALIRRLGTVAASDVAECAVADARQAAATTVQQRATADPALPASRGQPSVEQLDAVVALFNAGRYHAGEKRARRLTERYPNDGRSWKLHGTLLKALGNNAQALPALRRAAQLLSDDEQVHSNLGLVLADSGDLPAAEQAQRRALHIRALFPQAHYNLGNVLARQGRHSEAELSFRQAIAQQADFAAAHCNLGNALLAQGRLAEAEICYRQALALQPEMAEAYANLGDALHGQGRSEEAATVLDQALQYRPEFPEALFHLGNVFATLGRTADAEAAWRRALAARPVFPEALAVLGAALLEGGRLSEAEELLQRAVEQRPHLVEANYNLASALGQQGRLVEADSAWQRTLAIQPDFPAALVGQAIVLKQLGRLAEAEASVRHALACQPDLAEAYNTLGAILRDQERLSDAETSLRRALELKPELAGAYLNLGVTLADLGRHREAEHICRQALALKPDYALAHSNLLFCLTHNEDIDAPALFAEHRLFAEKFEAPLLACRRPHDNTADPDRRLRIGFVSGDLRHHAVANYVEPVLAHLAGRADLALHAYSTHPVEDHVSARLHRHFAHWHAVSGMNDADLAERIRSDRIDILLDLSGHTAHNRLLSFARKPAPLQASWMGYPATTGLQAMDYFLADRFFLPLGEYDDQFSEKIVRLPAGAPFLPFADAPPVARLPALARGHVTFGSFNRPNKISSSVVALWAELMQAVPGSRLLLAAMRPDGRSEQLTDEFSRHGIAAERLTFHPRCAMVDYLALHQQVDLCLDTFPYAGGTTTLHALWMGVPTLTLSGRTVPGRSGAAILGHAGVAVFVAREAGEFIACGRQWANDLSALAALRGELRERLRQSAMGRPELVAAGMAHALRRMWQRWCEQLPPASFEVSTPEALTELAAGTGQASGAG